MAGPPPPERVRELLTDKKQTAADHDKNGDLFMADGRPSIAIMFYERSRSRDRIQKVLKAGVDAGDTFLVEWVHKTLPELVTAREWKETGESAMKARKFTFARDAFRQAGDDAKVEEANKALNDLLTQKP